MEGPAAQLTNAGRPAAAAFGNLLISAGTETVARLLGWAGVVLDEHPDQRAELAADADRFDIHREIGGQNNPNRTSETTPKSTE